MKTAFLIIMLFLCPLSFASEDSVLLKMNSDFVLGDKDKKTVHKWKNTLFVESGKTYVANHVKKKSCSDDDDCSIEEFKTEITPEKSMNDIIKIHVVFTRKLGEKSNRIEGTVISQIGDHGEFGITSNEEEKLRYYIGMRTRLPQEKQQKK